MAITFGQVQPSLYQTPDYSGAAAASGAAQAAPYQMISDLAGQAKDYFKQQGEKKKALKAASTQIQAALTLMPELAPALSPIADSIKDENIPLNDRFADASIVGDLIKNSISAMQSQQMMNLRQAKFAASQGGGVSSGGSGGGGSSGGGGNWNSLTQ
jgi:hypothetical protein